MGTVISVDSVVYNMAGDPTGRPSYLKSLVVQKVLSSSEESMTDIIRNGYANGPAMRLRAFYRWAEIPENYDLVGLPTGKLEVNGVIDGETVAAEIPATAGKTVVVTMTKVSYADPEFWAEKYILQNHEELYGTAWEFEYLRPTNEIRVDFADGSSEYFTPDNFNYDDRYVYAYFTRTDNDTGEESGIRVFIYKIGSGNNALDVLVSKKADYGEFFPFIPIRLENKFISDEHKADVYEQTQAAYKKATGAELEDLVSDLKKNNDLHDIDNIYVTFGVSLNVKDDSCRKYIYRFFETLQAAQEGGADAHMGYENAVRQYNRSMLAYNTWVANGKKGPKPARKIKPANTTNNIRIRGTGDVNTHFDVEISWDYIKNFSKLGRGKPGAKPGDIWFKAKKTVIGQEEKVIRMGDGNYQTTYKDIHTTRLRLYWQRTKHEYTYLDVIGAEYKNTIYKGKAVIISPVEALKDTDESGFIIPLNYGVWRSVGMVHTTQMSTACVFAVMNCYKKQKTKWYQSSIFQIFLVIAIAVLSVVFTGGAGIGLLGSHLAIGTSLGLTGMSAAILGSVVNALAAMVLTTVLQKVAAALGPLGAILSALIGIVIGAVSASIASGSVTFNWSSLLRADNLMKLLSSVGDAAVQSVQLDTAGIYEDMVDFQEKAGQEAAKIQQAFFDEFGYGAGVIDPMMFVRETDIKIESASTFLNRTLMTGSDIVEMSQELLYDFPKYSLDLPDAFS